MGKLPELLTVAETAAMFEVSDETIHRWARKGMLPYVPLPSGTKRFKRAVVEAFLAPATGGTADRAS